MPSPHVYKNPVVSGWCAAKGLLFKIGFDFPHTRHLVYMERASAVAVAPHCTQSEAVFSSVR